MKTPFRNEPAALVALAFEKLYPGKEYEAELVPSLATEEGVQVCSCTTFRESGIPQVLVNNQLPSSEVAEALAHELAHVAAGVESLNDHGEPWKEAQAALVEKYDELGKSIIEEGGKGDEK